MTCGTRPQGLLHVSAYSGLFAIPYGRVWNHSYICRSGSRGHRRGRHHRGKIRGHPRHRSEEHTSELQSLMRISYAVFCLKKKKNKKDNKNTHTTHLSIKCYHDHTEK